MPLREPRQSTISILEIKARADFALPLVPAVSTCISKTIVECETYYGLDIYNNCNNRFSLCFLADSFSFYAILSAGRI